MHRGGISPPNPHKGGGYHPLSGVDIPPGRDFPPTLHSCLLLWSLSWSQKATFDPLSIFPSTFMSIYQPKYEANFIFGTESFWYLPPLIFKISLKFSARRLKMVIDFEALMLKKSKQALPLAEPINNPVRPLDPAAGADVPAMHYALIP